VDYIWNAWILLAFVAPALWALVNIVDVYFVDGIYHDELDGTIISGLFQIVPALALIHFFDIPVLPVVKEALTDSDLAKDLIMAIASGILFAASYYFYFWTLFHRNDVALLQVLWNLCIVVVPFLAFIIWGESLPFMKYVGMLIVLIGATALSFDVKVRGKLDLTFCLVMAGAIIFFSLCMVLQERVYHDLRSVYAGNGFWIGFIFFAFGGFLAGVLFAVIGRRNPFPFIRKYFAVFFGAEFLQFLGTICSQRTIDISPSVSFVATIETFVSVFVMMFSWLIILVAGVILQRKSETVDRIYQEQLDGFWVKLLAALVMAVGVYVIS
jgi:uncharacterized membrane protein